MLGLPGGGAGETYAAYGTRSAPKIESPACPGMPGPLERLLPGSCQRSACAIPAGERGGVPGGKPRSCGTISPWSAVLGLYSRGKGRLVGQKVLLLSHPLP